MKSIVAGDLVIAYHQVGPEDGPPIILLHGFPYDVHAYDSAAMRLAAMGRRSIVPYLRGYGPTRFRSDDLMRSGQQAALGSDLLALMDALAIRKAIVAGYDWGGRAACVVAALWPERVAGLVSCGTAYNVQDGTTATKPVAPEAEHRHWYWYYLNAERGRSALMEDRARLCRYLWRDFSPTWKFDDADFENTAASFDNPDFVDVVLHSYRFRIGSVTGDPKFDDLERRLAARPKITPPSVVLMGQDDAVDPPSPRSRFEDQFTDLRYVGIVSATGHNLPQEAADQFVDAVLRLGRPG